MEEWNYYFEKIFDVVLAFNNEAQYEKLLDVILTKMMEITYSDAGTLYIVEGDELCFKIIKNLTLEIFQTEKEIELGPIPLDEKNIENISAYVALKNETVVIDDVYNNRKFNFSGPKNYDAKTGYRTISMLAFPLSTSKGEGAKVLGVIQLINSVDPKTGNVLSFNNPFSLNILKSLTNLAAAILANSTHLRDMKNLFHSFIRVMTQAIGERSSYSSDHTKNVANLCRNFALYLGENFPPGHSFHFNESRVESLTVAALLHDIGKIIAPVDIMDKSTRLGDKIEKIRYRFQIKRHQIEIDALNRKMSQEKLKREIEKLDTTLEFIDAVNEAGLLTEDVYIRVNKLRDITYKNADGIEIPILDSYDMQALSIRKGNLTPDERTVMEEHVTITGRLLDKMELHKHYRNYKNVPEWVRNHKEFLDGSGYPRKLKANDIHLETCILTIIDIFDALTASYRPYKKSVSVGKALTILKEMADAGKLHKEMVRLFVKSKVWPYES